MSIFTERKIPLAQAPFDVHPATAWRWAMQGVRGVKLETYVIGGKRFTSQEACERFLAKMNQAPTAEAATR